MTYFKHRDYYKIKRWLTARDVSGYPIPVWGWGPPGSGKTHLAEQLATELAVQFVPTAWGPTSTDTRVVGFLSAGNGTYIPGPAYGWFRNGGLWFMDELDNAEPSALVSINSLLANKTFRFPNGELLTKHKDCYALAGANTLGTGATQGFRRQSQDAAARSRWAKVRIEYDEKLEDALAPVPQWVAYVRKVRLAVERLAKTNVWITPRDSIIGSAALRNGVPEEEVVEHLLCELSIDARNQVVNEVGVFSMTPKSVPEPKVSQEYEPLSEGVVSTPSGLESSPTWSEQFPYKKKTKKFRDYE
jgi:hypothetical protein